MQHSDNGAVEQAVAVFRTFGDATRLRLVRLLSAQRDPHALCVSALARRLGVSQSAVSQHLRVLRGVGLVNRQRRGYRMHYFLDPEALEQCRQLAREALSAGAEDGEEDCSEPCGCHGDG